jgi:membrane-associated phospholipid phosphatase
LNILSEAKDLSSLAAAVTAFRGRAGGRCGAVPAARPKTIAPRDHRAIAASRPPDDDSDVRDTPTGASIQPWGGTGLFHVEVAHPAGAASRSGGDADGVRAGRMRRRRLVGLGLGAGASVFALLALLHPSAWTAVAATLLTVLFIGRRSLRRVAKLLVFAVVPYEMIWMAFVAARGIGDEVSWVDRVRLWPRQLDVWLFGGEMPTTVLQRHLFDPDRLRPYDYFFTGLHVSFFVVPFLFAMPLCWIDVARGRRFLVALALLLAMGLPGFFLMPGNPPWMNPVAGDPNPAAAYRVNAYVAGNLGVDGFAADGTLKLEENSLAVIPSIHMGVSFLLALAAPVGRRRWRLLTRLYAVLMAVSLVYLGEHQVVDEIAGIGLAILAWRISPWVLAALSRRLSPVATATRARLAGAVAAGRRVVGPRPGDVGETAESEPAR